MLNTRTSLARFSLMSALLALQVGCTSEAARSTTRLTLTGSSTCAPLISEIARRYEAVHPSLRLDVQTGGSSRGIREVENGLADIGMSSRPLFAEERAGRVEHVFARDGVCLLVHATNPVGALDRDQVRSIYTGQIQNWRKVGGTDAPITVIDRADGRSEVSMMRRFFGIDVRQIDADAIAGENQQGIKQVASDPNAITYMSIGTAVYERGAGTAIKLLTMDGVEPTPAAVADGSYPLGRPLVLISRKDPTDEVVAFLAFAMSDAVRDLIEDYSFVVAAAPAK